MLGTINVWDSKNSENKRSTYLVVRGFGKPVEQLVQQRHRRVKVKVLAVFALEVWHLQMQ